MLRTLLSLAVFRLLTVVLIRSWFVPDEIYQSSEVAHVLVFSTGHISWEWSAALRSAIHPSLIAALYWLLSFANLDSQIVVSIAPRYLHALLFALGDYAYFSLADRLLPTSNGAYYAKMTYLSNWFIFYCSGRTLSNSLETIFTLLALKWYPWEGCRYQGRIWPYIAVGFLTIVVRPTAALIWLVLGINHLSNSSEPIKLIFRTALPTCTTIMGFSLIVDSFFYGKFTSTTWNFLMFNVLTGGSAHFGVHSWHWYFSQGIPSVLTVQMLPIIFGLFTQLRPTILPMIVSIFYIVFHSFLPHKEQRFLLPIIPLLSLYGGAFFATRHYYRVKRIFYWLMIIANLIIVLYTGLIHQVGPYASANSILRRNEADNKMNTSILVLMPCYSLPGHSYFHNKINELRQLDCSPDLKYTGMLDEADLFFDDPRKWLENNSIKHYEYILVYEKMYLHLSEEFTKNKFAVCDRVFHSQFLTSSREDHFIIVLCKS